jgi:tetratricopeptide (TPR) repeat protein
VTPDIGREICQRNGIKAMVHGSIASLGSAYVVTVDAVNASTGNSIAQEQSQADGKEKVLDALGQAGTSLREKLGESLASIQQFDKPLQEATTSSLEALKMNSEAADHNNNGDFLRGVEFSKRAVALDPNFAMAYRGLAVEYGNLGQSETALQYIRKAFELKDRASEREKLAITSDYYQYTGQSDKAIEAYEVYKQTYPRDSRPVTNLAVVYLILGNYDKALSNGLDAIRLSPEAFNGYSISAYAYIALKRLDEAKAILQTAQQRNLGSSTVHEQLAGIAIVQGDEATQAKEDALAKASPQGEFDLLQRDAALAVARGQFNRARDLLKQVEAKARAVELTESALGAIASRGLVEAVAQKRVEALQDADAALKLSQTPSALLAIADIYARSGADAKAAQLADRAAQERPEDVNVQLVAAPMIRALLAMNRHDPGKALELMKKGEAFDRANMESRYTRGEALLMGARGADAVQEFQGMLNLKDAFITDAAVSLAQLGLARAYVLTNDKEKARTAYQDFFALWKNADVDIPVLKQAKAEYKNLK